MAKLYGSVNGETKEINKLYGSVHKTITRYIVTGFDNRLPQYFNPTAFNNKYIGQYGEMEVAPVYLRVATAGGYSTARLMFQDNTYIDLFSWPEGNYTTQGNAWGFLTLAPVDGVAHSVQQVQLKDVATQIGKVYGSVNGEAKLIYNGITREAEGTSITINGTSDATLDSVTLKGDTFQQTYNGKNKLNLTVSPDSSAYATASFDSSTQSLSVVANGTNPSDIYYVRYDITGLTVGTTYVIKIGNFVNPSQSAFRYVAVSSYNGTSTSQLIALQSTQASGSFTIPSDCQALRVYLYTVASSTAVFSDVQIESGSTPTAYEPYVGGVPSPNPSYPQQIDTVTGEQTIKVVGKNLFNPTGLYHGYYTASNPSQMTSDEAYRTAVIDNLPAGTYTFSTDLTNCYILRWAINSTNTTIQGVRDTQTVTITESGTLKICFRNTSTTTITQDLNCQLELGSTATTYKPYQSQSYKVNLGKNLFDKDNANVLTGYIAGGGTHNITSGNNNATIWIPCYPNTTYTISKTASNVFRVGTTSSTPEIGVAVNDYVNDSTASSITITTDASAKFICAFIKNENTTETLQEMLASVQIELGSIATTYASYFTPIELCKIGTYQDYIWKDGSDWKIHKATGHKQLDVAITGIRQDGNAHADYVSYAGAFAITGGAWNSAGGDYNNDITYARQSTNCGQYELQTISGNANANSMKDGTFCQRSGTNDRIYMRFSSLAGKTGAELKAILSAQGGSDFYYYLATPTDTAITDATLISQLEALASAQSYDPQTNITATTPSPNLPTILDVVAFINGFTGPLS